MKRQQVYDELVKARDKNIALLFQRLNFFLIATAFLIAGFVTSYAAARSDTLPDLVCISYVLIATGIGLSFFFAFVNFLNTRILFYMGLSIKELEKKNLEEEVGEDEFPSKLRDNNVNKVMSKGLWRLLGEKCCELGALSLVLIFRCSSQAVRQKAQQSVASHVYVVPLGFTIMWITLLIIVLSSCI
ncbi:MAG TPA: hypothetical protein VMW45_04175 [Dehalococcoidia bacterium]|nr:hypothetical protein [Dehalococcoidia bacterium]